MVKVINLVSDRTVKEFLPAFRNEALPEDAVEQEQLKEMIARLKAHPMKKAK